MRIDGGPEQLRDRRTPHLKPFPVNWHGTSLPRALVSRHFMQSCIPNLHRPPLTGLLQPLDMLKCQHIGFPDSVFRAKPASSSGNCGAGLSVDLGRLKGFLGDWAWPARFRLQRSLRRLLRRHLGHCYQVHVDPRVVHQPFKGLLKRWSAPGCCFERPLVF